MKALLKKSISLIILLFISGLTYAQIRTLDEFENKNGWDFIKSDGVNLNLSNEKGFTGNAVRFDYDFTQGTGYGGIQKLFPIELPDNYEFTFYVKAESPANNFEIKFIDSTGNNVWWVSNRNFEFPTEWKKISIKKRHISFAWGPNSEPMKRVDRIEFTVASFVGGKGTLWIDNLKFQPLQPETNLYPTPLLSATSSVKKHEVSLICDNLPETFWQSKNTQDQEVVIDFKTNREFGGLQINWLKDFYARDFEILLSEDAKNWEKFYSVHSNQDNLSFIRLAEAEARFVKLKLGSGKSEKGFGISDIKFLDIKNSLTPNDFLIYSAKNSPTGNYPRYFLEQASYWTITGVNNDVKEAMINEDGMVEVDKALFSIEPMLKMGDSVYNWSNVKTLQSLGDLGHKRDFDFIPTVNWLLKDLTFETAVTASGEANKSSQLDIRYTFNNLSDKALDFEFYLLIRPYQVNPYYQFLNLPGGVGKIKSIKEESGNSISVDGKSVLFQKKYDSFGASVADEGNIVQLLRNGKIPTNKSAFDNNSLANGVVKYKIHLNPGEKSTYYVVVPFYGDKLTQEKLNISNVADEFAKSSNFWKNEVGHVKFNLPSSADRIINTYRSNLAYVLVNRDKAGIQPGSRSYERSWIRDGALTSSALLKSGIVTEVRDFIDWYAVHQYENGKVPCVVDHRGPDPVPENDSHGQLIYLLREYFNFTHDTIFLKSKNSYVLKAVEYIEELVAQRSTDYFKFGNDSLRSFYGLMPESISHEGYSAKPMHSYWDDFFTIKGLKDAVEIQKILGETANYERIKKLRDTFTENLYNSLQLAMKNRKIDYIPGCAELGDFDATSTTIALTPCNELKNLPKPQVYNTFDKYYEFFKNRRDGKTEWVNYTPYENRLIGSFIMLDQPEKAHELISYFLNDQRPQGWNHWAEVVWKDYRIPRYIGDMPHTWCGSDFINSFRSMFVYENEYDHSLVLASALYQDWIDTPKGMSVENLPTYYGEISYSIQKETSNYRVSITGDVKLPDNGIKIKNFNHSALPKKVLVNGKEIKAFSEKEISVKEIPAEVVIFY